MKKSFLVIVVLLLSMGLVNAVSLDELNEAKALMDSNISCNKLTNDQLEIIGEYYMEQTMPGQAHARAHEMMGLKEGSEAEELFHISVARRSYCGENVGMMREGLYNGYGMMGYYPRNYNYFSYWDIILGALIIGLLMLAFWMIYRSLKKNNADQEDALSVIRKRYARGEITTKQFEEIKKKIRV